MKNSVEKFNALDGVNTYRWQLRKVLNQAKKEGRTDIVKRISKVLKDNPSYKEFFLSITDKAFGEIESNLRGLEQLDLDESEGLGKPISPNEIYQYITDMVINLIEKKTEAKWINPMSKNYEGVGSLATNFVSKKKYRGINSIMLNFIHPEQRGANFDNPYFLTFKQITAKKGKLKKGSKGYRIVYFTKVISKKEKEEAKEDGVEPIGFPMLKYYNVFNGEDIEGIDWKLKEVEPKTDSEKLEVAQLIIDNMPKPPKFKQANNGAFYMPRLDVVNIPPVGAFDSKENYYSVFFHELIHSTKHKSRLNDSDRGGRQGTIEYAKEELVAELGAVFLSAEAGNLISTINNSAAYLKGWKSRLIKSLRADNKFFFRASSKAQAAADYILDRNKEGVPAYIKSVLKANKVVKKIIIPKDFKKYNGKYDSKLELFYLDIDNTLEKVKDKSFFDLMQGSIYIKKVEVNNLIGYGLVDNISGEILASKKTMPELKKTYKTLKINNEFSEMPILVYEIIKKNNKNILGKKVKVSWENEIKKINSKTKQIALFGISKDSDTIKFNKQIIKAAKKGYLPTDIFLLGKPKEELKKQIKNYEISMTGKVLSKITAQTKDHKINWGNLIDLPDYINNPMAIFKSKTKGFVVLTEVKDVEGKPIMIALHIDSKNELTNIASIYSRRKYSAYKNWIKKGLNLYVNKKSDLFPYTQATIAVGGKNSLSKNKDTKNKPKSNLKGVKSSKVNNIAFTGDSKPQFYKVNGAVGEFLQAVECKPIESVVITLDGSQGAGKTTTLYKFMDAFAKANNKCLFISGEEHPLSSLAQDKVKKHLTPSSRKNIDAISDVDDVAELYQLVNSYEIIFIDSWQKLIRMVGAIKLDEDLRKKFNGKVFVIIFQQTTTGRTKGGAEIVFDGDIIIKMVKEDSFKDNYAYFDKNRYTKVPLENLRYNILSGKCFNPNLKKE